MNFQVEALKLNLKDQKQLKTNENTRTIREVIVLHNLKRKFLGLDKTSCPFL